MEDFAKCCNNFENKVCVLLFSKHSRLRGIMREIAGVVMFSVLWGGGLCGHKRNCRVQKYEYMGVAM